jgi:hypothetical protein
VNFYIKRDEISKILNSKIVCAKFVYTILLLIIVVLSSVNGSTSYGLDPNFILRTGIEGGISSQTNVAVQCSNSPLWPQAEQNVDITANALDGTAQTKLAVDLMEIFVNDNMTVPVATISNNSTLNYTFRVSTDSPIMSYSCRVVDNGTTVFSGWKIVRIETRAIPIIYSGEPNSSLDILFIADKDTYFGPTDPNFLFDVEKAIQMYYNETIFLKNQDKINFWVAQDVGDARGECTVEPPSNWDSDYTFAEVGIILHGDNSIRDCALAGAEQLFTTNMRVLGRANITLLHETGHLPFGLADEYEGDGGYFITNPFPNIFASDSLCKEDELGKERECRKIGNIGREFFTSDTIPEDLMADNLKIQMLDERRIQWLFDCLRNNSSYVNATNCRNNNISDTSEPTIAQIAQHVATNTGSDSQAVEQVLQLLAAKIDGEGGNADQAITQIGHKIAAEGEQEEGQETEALEGQPQDVSHSIAQFAQQTAPNELAIRRIAENVALGADVLQTLVQVAEQTRATGTDTNINQEQVHPLNFTDLTAAEFVSADDDITNTDKSLVVRLNFTDLTAAEFVSADVSFGDAHTNFGNPPLLGVQAYDYSGNVIQDFNYWHPLWAFDMKEDGHEALRIMPSNEGRIVFPFDPRIASMQVSYIYSEDGEAIGGDHVISVDLRPTIHSFCEEFSDDPSCQISDLAIADVSTVEPQLSILVGESAEVIARTTSVNNGRDAPIDAIMSSKAMQSSFSTFGIRVTSMVESSQNGTRMTLPLQSPHQHDELYRIECFEPGKYSVTIESQIAPLSGVVVDANKDNDKGHMIFQIDCGLNPPIESSSPPPLEPTCPEGQELVEGECEELGQTVEETPDDVPPDDVPPDDVPPDDVPPDDVPPDDVPPDDVPDPNPGVVVDPDLPLNPDPDPASPPVG